MTAKAPSREVLFAIEQPSGPAPLYRQLYEQARDAIVQGRLEPGDKLPSIRRLAKDLGVSHTTVEQAYLLLSVEGYVRNVARSGYVVERLDTDFLQLPKSANLQPEVERAAEERDRDSFYAENRQGEQVLYDFSYANLWTSSFPVQTWRKLVNDVLYAREMPALTRYSYTDEPSALSHEVARYLSQARGVNCLPEQVVFCAGTDGALAVLLQLFDATQHTLGIEEPGYATVREVASRMGFSLAALPVGKGIDSFLDSVQSQTPKLVFTTPSHQFPTGGIMPLDARTRLLKWAEEACAYIIEDDSCCEYRFGLPGVPSLQSLDAFNRVVYLGNFSKALSPSMRIAYLVLPPKLLGRYWRLFNHAHPSVPYLEQEVLARFMRDGLWDAHLRKMAQGMRRRHDALLECLQDTLGDRVGVEGVGSGMHFYLTVDNGMTQQELLGSALAHKTAVYGTRRMWFANPAPEGKLMLGFSSIEPEDIPEGVKALKRAWFS